MATNLYTLAEIKKHTKAKDCWVIYNNNVYDVSPFIADHPGGDDLILKYGGRDVTEIMKDKDEHEHSESAYEIFEEYLIGQVSEEPLRHFDGERARLHRRRVEILSKEEEFETYGKDDFKPVETNVTTDIKANQFLDLRKALIPQIMRANYTKEFYLEQVHKPRYLPHPAIFFGHPLLEPFTKTAWYMVPSIWFPYVAYQLSQSLIYLRPALTFSFFGLGIFIWTLLEYILHRFLFHLDDLLPEHQIAYLLHFSLHGFHHYLPMDRLRLVVPPALFVVLAIPFVSLGFALFPIGIAHAIVAGAIFGYVLYDITHYYLHHAKIATAYLRDMKKYHLAHHYKDFEAGYGITSKFWDYCFSTVLSYN
ncbi:hypothetical protein CLU79DRAFT_728276 [Phycomyces nitens]|nr:hypothetical protein CLU79DRAFT_728276 [Phycomyces nitens]